MNIYTIANANYINFLKNFLASPGFANFKGKIIVISPDLEESGVNKINKQGLNVEIREPVVNGYAFGRFPGFLFSRFAELLSDESDAMYIDSDTIVQKPIESILKGFEGDGLYAVEEKLQKYPFYFKVRYLRARYYNAGVIFKKGPAIFSKAECVNHVNEFSLKSRYPDQDFFNTKYYSKIKTMNSKYNYMNYQGRPSESDTVIYHLAHKKYLIAN